MTKLTWALYPVGNIIKITDHRYVLRVAPSVSDLTPKAEKIFSDSKLTVTGFYNKRGYSVGYSLEFADKPAVIADNFYLLLDYVDKKEKPKHMTVPKLGGRQDSSIRLIKFGNYLKHRMYIFIYRRKKDG